jgi:hypothetical protein
MILVRFAIVTTLFIAASTPAFAQPPAATPISPSADVSGTTIAFTWHSAAGATWYHFWLSRPNTTLVTEQWYTAEHAGCATGGTCTIMLTPPLGAGPYIWYVRTWGSSGYGPWSAAFMFAVREQLQSWAGKLPPSRRFSLVLDDAAVLDNETGLVWERAPIGTTSPNNDSTAACMIRTTGGRHGWRVPTASELRSVFENTGAATRLPPGHPFVLPAEGYYWTATRKPDGQYHYAVYFPAGATGEFFIGDPNSFRLLCVRGGAAPNQ